VASQEGPRSTDARLDLVGDEKRSRPVAKVSQAAEKPFGGRNDSTFALHWLDDDTRHVVVQQILDGFEITVGRMNDGAQRAEAVSVFFLARDG
jgi:hypothetical protein